MRTFIFFIIVLFFGCQEKEPTLFGGTATVLTTDGEERDTLNICYCWQTNDSLNIRVLRDMSFAGISVDVTAKDNIYKSSLQYYSDTNQFNGEFERDISLLSDSLTVSFEDMLDSIRINGYVKLKSQPENHNGSKRIIKAVGNFSCVMSK